LSYFFRHLNNNTYRGFAKFGRIPTTFQFILIFQPIRAKSQFFLKRASIHGPNFVPQKFNHVKDIIRTSSEKFGCFCTRDELITNILSVNSRRNEKINPLLPSELQNIMYATFPWLGLSKGRPGPVPSKRMKISIGMTLIVISHSSVLEILPVKCVRG
jgi:hypothetical protein